MKMVKNDLVRYAAEEAAELFGGDDGAFNLACFSAALCRLAKVKGPIDGRLCRAILWGRSDIKHQGKEHFSILPIVKRATGTQERIEQLSAVLQDVWSLVRPGQVSPGSKNALACDIGDCFRRAGILDEIDAAFDRVAEVQKERDRVQGVRRAALDAIEKNEEAS